MRKNNTRVDYTKIDASIEKSKQLCSAYDATNAAIKMGYTPSGAWITVKDIADKHGNAKFNPNYKPNNYAILGERDLNWIVEGAKADIAVAKEDVLLAAELKKAYDLKAQEEQIAVNQGFRFVTEGKPVTIGNQEIIDYSQSGVDLDKFEQSYKKDMMTTMVTAGLIAPNSQFLHEVYMDVKPEIISKSLKKASGKESLWKRYGKPTLVGLVAAGMVLGAAYTVVSDNNKDMSLGDILHAKWTDGKQTSNLTGGSTPVSNGSYSGDVNLTTTPVDTFIDIGTYTTNFLADLSLSQNGSANVTQGLVNLFLLNNSTYEGNLTLKTIGNSSLDGTLNMTFNGPDPVTFRQSYMDLNLTGVNGDFTFNNNTRLTGAINGAYNGSMSGTIADAKVNGSVDWQLEDAEVNGNMTMTGAEFKNFWNDVNMTGTMTLYFGNGEAVIVNNQTFDATSINDTEEIRLAMEDVTINNGRITGFADLDVTGNITGTTNGIWQASDVDLLMTGGGSATLIGTATGEMELTAYSGTATGNFTSTVFDAWLVSHTNSGSISGGGLQSEIDAQLFNLYLDGGVISQNSTLNPNGTLTIPTLYANGTSTGDIQLPDSTLEAIINSPGKKISHFPVDIAALAAFGLGAGYTRKGDIKTRKQAIAKKEEIERHNNQLEAMIELEKNIKGINTGYAPAVNEKELQAIYGNNEKLSKEIEKTKKKAEKLNKYTPEKEE